MDEHKLTTSDIDALDLKTALTNLGLEQYYDRLQENGFESWATVKDITESDLAALGFKLGDRRKLQRAVREYGISGAPRVEPLEAHAPLSQQTLRATRQYRRHPKPDPNAPLRPKTAYVLFGEHVRQDPALSHLSFANIAKETGKRWGGLLFEERVNTWERPASDKLQEYKEELELYKQTDQYGSYQEYLHDFKQRHNQQESALSVDAVASTPRSAIFDWQHPSPSYDERDNGNDKEDRKMEDQWQDMTPPVKSGMEECRLCLSSLGINTRLVRVAAFPPEDVTMHAVQGFLHGTGALLYLWDHDEALELVNSVYHPQNDAKPLYATEVFAMAAVGAYCDAETNTSVIRERFLSFFLSMLCSPSDLDDLRRMRLFACLAICRFTASVASSRVLMLSSLDIGRKVFTSAASYTELSEDKARYWWNVFRSIIFLESWLAYNTSHESRVTSQDVNLYNPPRSQAERPLGIFQERVGELGQLAAYIALDLKRAIQPKVEQAHVHFESLSEWHRTLPPPMQLSRISLSDALSMNWHTKRSLLQLHIVFLGLFIEPYRNCLVDLGQHRLSRGPMEPRDLETLKNVEEQCVLAARQSARVASLLQVDNLIRSRCWVSVYTCFTGCTILLFSASQKLLELRGEDLSHDLLYVSSHLNVLSLCSYDNDIARKLYTTLQILYNELREIVLSPTYFRMRECQMVIQDPDLVPRSYYDVVEDAAEVADTIRNLTKRIMVVMQERLSM